MRGRHCVAQAELLQFAVVPDIVLQQFIKGFLLLHTVAADFLVITGAEISFIVCHGTGGTQTASNYRCFSEH